MELLQLRYFCDAARLENFSHAAKKNGVPTSNISQTVRRLEEELGVKLFGRTANKITLTDEGRRFYDGASSALMTLDNTRASLCETDTEPTGELKLLIRVHRRTSTVAIERFKSLCPKVRILISHDAEIDSSAYSFIISDGRDNNDKCAREHLMTERFMLAVSRDNPLANRQTVSVSELATESFVLMKSTSPLSAFTTALCRASGFEPRIAISTDDPFYVRKYVDMGLGVALVPEISWQGQLHQNTALVDIGDCFRDIYVYFHKDRAILRHERIFLEILREAFIKE
ncbi:MAG: LysR family transcriptional regulator [Clostridia bacterium]|nr:LysR family transcriptional regulator [Clostridia bacterium]